jgi:hypothetical protein
MFYFPMYRIWTNCSCRIVYARILSLEHCRSLYKPISFLLLVSSLQSFPGPFCPATKMFILASLFLFSIAITGTPLYPRQITFPCGGLVVGIRDTNDDPFTGQMATLVNYTLEFSNSDDGGDFLESIMLDYPAVGDPIIDPDTYFASVQAGAAALTNLFETQHICSHYTILAAGQGAQVATDWIAGGVGIPAKPVTESPGSDFDELCKSTV